MANVETWKWTPWTHTWSKKINLSWIFHNIKLIRIRSILSSSETIQTDRWVCICRKTSKSYLIYNEIFIYHLYYPLLRIKFNNNSYPISRIDGGIMDKFWFAKLTSKAIQFILRVFTSIIKFIHSYSAVSKKWNK